jgi:hypothetical protein
LGVWTVEELNTLDAYYGKVKKQELVKLLPARTPYAIAYQAAMRGLKANRHVTNRRLTPFNEAYFSIPNSVNSYWAGFLAADGSIYKNNVTFYQREIEPLEKLRAEIGHTCKILNRDRGFTIENSISFASQQMVDDLKNNYFITPAKSLTLRPPKHLDRDCSLSFITGFIDGDGTISFARNKKTGYEYPVVSITGTRPMLEWMSLVSGQKYSICRRSDCKDGLTFKMSATHNKARGFLFPLHNHKATVPHRLRRKWDVAERFLEGYLQ